MEYLIYRGKVQIKSEKLAHLQSSVFKLSKDLIDSKCDDVKRLDFYNEP